jgi:hypothetical protein
MTKILYYRGLDIKADVSIGYEGDASIPGGLHRLVEVEFDYICANDGEDITDMLTEDAIEEIKEAVLEDGE